MRKRTLTNTQYIVTIIEVKSYDVVTREGHLVKDKERKEIYKQVVGELDIVAVTEAVNSGE